MIDLDADSTTGTATIAAITPKREGDDGDSLGSDLVLAFEVATEDDASVVDRVVPGAHAHWERSRRSREASESATALEGAAAGQVAAAGRWANVNVRESVPTEYRVSLASVEGDDALCEATATLRAVRLAATPKGGTVLVLRLRLHDLGGDAIGRLAEHLDNPVEVVLLRVQPVLHFPSRPVPRLGDVVVFTNEGAECAGLVVGRAEQGGTFEVDDLGSKYAVDESSVTSAVSFVPPDGYDMPSRCKHLRSLAKKAGVRVSWSHVVQAAGQATATGTATHAGDAVVLDMALCSASVDLAVAIAPARTAQA